MFRIGDFSKLGQVSTRMLRHYDKLGLLVPNQVDQWTGYRYYTIDQLPRLHRLMALKELGFTLEQIGDLLEQDDELSPEQLRGMFLMRQAEIERELREGQTRLANVTARLHQIEQEGQPSPYEIMVKAVPAQSVAGIRQRVPHLSEMDYYCEKLYAHLYTRLARLNIPFLEPELTLYHNDEYTETNIDVEAAVPIAPEYLDEQLGDEQLVFHDLPASQLSASLIFEGPFREVASATLELLRWIGFQRHTIAGPMRELHLSGPAHVEGIVQESAVIELQAPIREFTGETPSGYRKRLKPR